MRVVNSLWQSYKNRYNYLCFKTKA